MMQRTAFLATVIIALAAACAGAAEHEAAVTFREPVGFTWPDELVHHDLSISQPRVAAAAFSLRDATGQAVPIQTEVLEGTPEAVRRVRVWFKMTLPADQSVAYRLTWNEEGKAAPAPVGGAPAAAGSATSGSAATATATVRRAGERLILSTGVAGVVMPAPGKAFPSPLDFAKAPAPILGARVAGDRTLYGDWRLEGSPRVREIRTTLEAAGPVWAQVRLQYVLEKGGQNYEVVLRGVAGEPWIDVTETYHLAAGARMIATLGDRLKPAEALWMPWYVGGGGRTDLVNDVRRVSLAEQVHPDHKPLATLRPRWTQTLDASPVCLAISVGDGAAPIGSAPAPGGTGSRGGAPAAGGAPAPGGVPAIGAMMTCPAEWQRPYEQFVTVRAQEEGRSLTMEFPLAEGRRRWALLAGPVARFDSKVKLQTLVRRSADLPLDRVLNEYVLEWRRDGGNPAPHILTTAARLAAIRADVTALANTSGEPDATSATGASGGLSVSAADAPIPSAREVAAPATLSPTARLVERVLAGQAPGDRVLAEFLAGRREALPAPAITVVDVLARGYQDDALAPPAWPRQLAAALRAADLASAGRPAGDARIAMIGYIFSDPNFAPLPGSGWTIGSPAFALDLATPAVYAAAMMPDHPQARRWMASGLAALRDDFHRAVGGPGGPAAVSPGAAVSALAARLPVMRAAQNSGLDDPMRWPEVRASLELLRSLHSPLDPRVGRRLLVPLGGTAAWQDDAGAVFAMAAAGMKPIDEKMASTWMTMYHEYGADVGAGGDLARDVFLVDPSPTAARIDPAAWTSRRLPGLGVVLRSRAGTPGETFASFKCGGAAGYHAEELSFHFYGAGMPIALDWACGDRPRAEQEHMHNRANLGTNENMDAVGDLLAMAESAAGDVAVGQVRSDRLRRMPRYPQDIMRHESFPRRTLAAEARYRRFLLLVKHPAGPMEDYLVIRDEFVSSEPATFNLFVLARSVRQHDRTFTFDGQLAADAVLFMATPDADNARAGAWGWPAPDESSLVPKDFRLGTDRWRTGEFQQGVRIPETPGRPFLAVLYPYRKGSMPPTFQALAGGRGVRVTLGSASEDVYLATDPPLEAGGQATVRRDGQTTVILKAKAVPAM